jgi:putative flippase GtrA
VRKKIIAFINFFHLPLFQFIPAETFRYLFCGVSTLVVDWVVFSFSLHFIFQKQSLQIADFSFSATSLSKATAIVAGFVWGFGLNKYIVFTQSSLKGRVQLFRYTIIVGTCIILNFIIIKILLTQIPSLPTFANIITSLLVAVYSYIVQRSFTFKVSKKSNSSDS